MCRGLSDRVVRSHGDCGSHAVTGRHDAPPHSGGHHVGLRHNLIVDHALGWRSRGEVHPVAILHRDARMQTDLHAPVPVRATHARTRCHVRVKRNRTVVRTRDGSILHHDVVRRHDCRAAAPTDVMNEQNVDHARVRKNRVVVRTRHGVILPHDAVARSVRREIVPIDVSNGRNVDPVRVPRIHVLIQTHCGARPHCDVERNDLREVDYAGGWSVRSAGGHHDVQTDVGHRSRDDRIVHHGARASRDHVANGSNHAIGLDRRFALRNRVATQTRRVDHQDDDDHRHVHSD